jgi:antitoxin (DNA-binding transcriptional repressor) of toxin-antitoxin stability system
MGTVNIGTLKNQLSAYLRYVRNGEEVVVRDRKTPIARILPLQPDTGFDREEARLVAEGRLTLPKNTNPMDWDAFWALPRPNVSDEAIKETIDWAKSEIYSIFDSAVYRKLEAEWLFPQEKATLYDLQMATCESKML